MKHLELFAGIGGFRRALDLLSRDGVMHFECVGYSEIDRAATKTYKANFNPGNDELEMGDIVEFTSSPEKMASLPQFDLLTGGFPCQTFSMMGKQEGFNEDRGQMFFRILDIIDARRPRYILLENVKNLFTHNRGNTFGTIKSRLEERGYNVIYGIFNSSDFHLPQTRNRVIIFATLDTLPDNYQNVFTPANVAGAFDLHCANSSVNTYGTTLDILSKSVDEKYFLSERIKPTILADGSAKFRSNSEINLLVARPLTATMHKMHRACQDNYFSQDFIESEGRYNPAKECSKEELAAHKIRKITPAEAFMLQGFPGEFAINGKSAGVGDGALYKQAGNAVSVNTVYAVLHFLIRDGIIVEQ